MPATKKTNPPAGGKKNVKKTVKKPVKKVKKVKKTDVTDSILALNDALQPERPYEIPKKPIKKAVENLPQPTSVKNIKNQDFGTDLRYEDYNGFRDLSFLSASWRILKIIVWPFLKIQKVLARNEVTVSDLELDNESQIEDIFAPQQHARWYRSIFLFVAIALFIMVPLQLYVYYQNLSQTKNNILSLSVDAIDNLRSGQELALSFDLFDAAANFDMAKDDFSQARARIDGISSITTKIIKIIPGVNKSFEAGIALIESGEIFAEVGQILANAGNNFMEQRGDDYYTALLVSDRELSIALEKFREGKSRLEKVEANQVPEEYRQDFLTVVESLPILEKHLTDAKVISSALLSSLGRDQWQRYLLMFANNNEQRAVGGFLGSFALLDVDRGEIKGLEVPAGGTYDLQGQLVPRVMAPDPIHLINPRWEFHDSNWWPDFPRTARKIQWFYENAGGPSTDGVIVMTATMMSRLIDVLGPIYIEGDNTAITGANFTSLTQSIIREKRDEQDRKPKQFLSDLAPEIMERVFSAKGDVLKDLLAEIQKGFNEKHIVIYFSDSERQDVVGALGWDGHLRATDGDFLSVVHTNLAGGKTDEVMTQIINHQAELQSDGDIINTVTLVRTHNGPDDNNIFTGVQNNSYVRFYVPSGSTLIGAQGFEKPDDKFFDIPDDTLKKDVDLLSVETQHSFDKKSGTDIYKESGKTVFGNWLQIKPGETKEAKITYRLPFKLTQEGNDLFYYSLLAQKQTGDFASKVISQLNVSETYDVVTKFPTELISENNLVIFEQDLTTDQFYGVVLRKVN